MFRLENVVQIFLYNDHVYKNGLVNLEPLVHPQRLDNFGQAGEPRYRMAVIYISGLTDLLSSFLHWRNFICQIKNVKKCCRMELFKIVFCGIFLIVLKQVHGAVFILSLYSLMHLCLQYWKCCLQLHRIYRLVIASCQLQLFPSLLVVVAVNVQWLLLGYWQRAHGIRYSQIHFHMWK